MKVLGSILSGLSAFPVALVAIPAALAQTPGLTEGGKASDAFPPTSETELVKRLADLGREDPSALDAALEKLTGPELLKALKQTKVTLRNHLRNQGVRVDREVMQTISASGTSSGYLFSLALLGYGQNKSNFGVAGQTSVKLDNEVYVIRVLDAVDQRNALLKEIQEINARDIADRGPLQARTERAYSAIPAELRESLTTLLWESAQRGSPSEQVMIYKSGLKKLAEKNPVMAKNPAFVEYTAALKKEDELEYDLSRAHRKSIDVFGQNLSHQEAVAWAEQFAKYTAANPNLLPTTKVFESEIVKQRNLLSALLDKFETVDHEACKISDRCFEEIAAIRAWALTTKVVIQRESTVPGRSGWVDVQTNAFFAYVY